MADATEPQVSPRVIRARRLLAGFKFCFACETEKPLTDFSISKCRTGGRETKCRECMRAYRSLAHRKQWQKQYYLANSTKIKATSTATRATDPDRRKRHYAVNKEKQKAGAAAWRAENPERMKATAAAYYAKNADKRAAYRDANRDRLLAISAKWKSDNPDKRSAQNANRRARLRGAGGSFTADDVAEILKLQKHKCAHPWCRISLKDGFHRDHIIPLAKGGSNVRTNLQLLCQSCNLKKFTKHPIDFARENGMLL